MFQWLSLCSFVVIFGMGYIERSSFKDHLSMQIKPAIRLTEVKPCQSLGVVGGVWWCGDIFIPKAKGTLSGCILSWIHEI